MKSKLATSEVYVTSAPFACGIAWLTNALLSLGFRATSLTYKDNSWEKAPNGRYRVTIDARDHLLSHLPILHSQTDFEFRPSPQFLWEHRLRFDAPTPTGFLAPVIVVIRDPRDAIFSLYRRWKKNGWYPAGDFIHFLDAPSEWPHHFPGLFDSVPSKTFAFFYLVWRFAARERPVHFVRFEDFKERPHESLNDILKFLRLPKQPRTALDAAIESSATEKARLQIESMTARPVMNAVHKGQSFEWKTTYERDALERFSHPALRASFRLLGYEAAPSELDGLLKKLVDPEPLNLLKLFRPKSPDSRLAELTSVKHLSLLKGIELVDRLNRGDTDMANPFWAPIQVLNLKRHLIALEWARQCTSAKNLDDWQAFLTDLTALMLDASEIEYIYGRLKLHSERR